MHGTPISSLIDNEHLSTMESERKRVRERGRERGRERQRTALLHFYNTFDPYSSTTIFSGRYDTFCLVAGAVIVNAKTYML